MMPTDSTTADTIEVRQERSLQLALASARTAADNRGQNIVVLDMRPLTPVFDYFVLVTGSSRRQLHAISEEIDHRLEDEMDDKRMGIEGYNESHWILLDYGSVVIHMFDEETRDYYALEDLWNMAEKVPLPWEDSDTQDSDTQESDTKDSDTQETVSQETVSQETPSQETSSPETSSSKILEQGEE